MKVSIHYHLRQSETNYVAYMWNLKKKQKRIYKREIRDVENKLIATGGKGREG